MKSKIEEMESLEIKMAKINLANERLVKDNESLKKRN